MTSVEVHCVEGAVESGSHTLTLRRRSSTCADSSASRFAAARSCDRESGPTCSVDTCTAHARMSCSLIWQAFELDLYLSTLEQKSLLIECQQCTQFSERGTCMLPVQPHRGYWTDRSPSVTCKLTDL